MIGARISAFGAAFLLWSALQPVPTLAQRDTSAIVRGAVLGPQSVPIQDVEIYAPGTGRGARTGPDGRFVLNHLLAGPARLLVRRLGWLPIDTTVRLAPGSDVDLHIEMRRIPQELDRVLIIANAECPNRTVEGFECRRRAGVGVFRDSAELAAIRPIYLADLLYGVDGLRRVPVRGGVAIESVNGWRCLTTLIDGRRPYQRELQMLRPEDYIAIEFYDHYDKVPEWYKSMASQRGAYCAMVVYWTRSAPRYDPKLDPGKSVTQAREARRAAQARLLDSLRAPADSAPPKKPRT